ncbi:T-complex protein 1 subunit delta, partial [Haematococcus lacustris]
MAVQGRKGELYKESAKKKDVRTTNIESAKAVADAVRTSLGPKGMDKMVSSPNGDIIITNDGATILQKMTVTQPAAKMLVELSKSQDVVAGDGTTSVVVICGALLKKCQDLLARGVHPTTISDSFNKAAHKACAVSPGASEYTCQDVACHLAVPLSPLDLLLLQILESVAIPVNLDDRESLLRAATTSLSSKVVSQYSSLLSPMAVDSVLQVMDPARPNMLDLRDIRVISKPGGTVDDSQLVDGLVFDQKAAKAAGGPTRVEAARIALIQFCASPPKPDLENNVVVSDYAQMDR